MATYNITTNTTAAGPIATMAEGESTKVFAGVSVLSTDPNMPAIAALASNSDIEILGSVQDSSSSVSAVIMGNAANTSNNSLTVGADGSITGNTKLWSFDSSINNLGTMDGIYVFCIDNGGMSTIDNSGEISDEVAIQRNSASTEKLQITNTGTITGSEYSFYSFPNMKVVDVIINNGVMKGAVQLGEGNDSYTGTGSLNGNLFLGGGNDVFVGGGDISGYVDAGAGKDKLTGDDDLDKLRGGAGNDTLDGAGGNDLLWAGVGADKQTGGKGRDVFVFIDVKESTNGSFDTIMDFAKGDTIELYRIDANGKKAGNGQFDFIGKSAFSGDAGELRFQVKGGDTYVYGDIDGNGKADLVIKFDDVLNFKQTDFAL